MNYTLHVGDCLDWMATMPDNTYNAVFCDPPYGLGETPDMTEVLTHWLAGDDYKASGGGFMGKSWDSFVPGPSIWKEAYRVCKPGAVLLAFGGTRTADLLSIAIRLAGWQRWDELMWVYGSGFPKSHDISKAIDKAAGATREVVGESRTRLQLQDHDDTYGGWKGKERTVGGGVPITAPATPEAAAWSGYGSALKPSYEPILCFRKPLESTYAHSALTYGTGAINVDGCRVEGTPRNPGFVTPGSNGIWGDVNNSNLVGYVSPSGRFPANLIHDGSDDVLAVFDRAGVRKTGAGGTTKKNNNSPVYSGPASSRDRLTIGYDDTGSAARFFKCCPQHEPSCALCSLPVSQKRGIMNESQSNDSGDNIPCNANSVRMSLSQDVKNNSIVGDLVPGLLPLEIEGKSESSPLNVLDAASTLMDMQATTPSIVQKNALILQELPNVLSARFAGNLCDSCATAIAQSLVQMLQGNDQESRQCLDFISERKRQILHHNLVQCAEILANTDITQITTILKLWSGSVYLAIEDCIRLEKAEQTASSSNDQARFLYSSKASRAERTAGLDGDNPHPCLKPLSLCEYLARLIVPPESYRDDAQLLNLFAGSGSEAIGAAKAGWRNITGIEIDPEYCEINRRRFDYWTQTREIACQPSLLEVA